MSENTSKNKSDKEMQALERRIESEKMKQRQVNGQPGGVSDKKSKDSKK